MSDPVVTAARREYDLQVHAVLLRTMRAVLQADRANRDDAHPASVPIDDELAGVEQAIAQLAADPADRPMHGLALRLGWSEDEVGFVWAVVALSINPRLLVHARALDDHATRGLSLSLYGRIAGLSPEASRELGLAFVGGHSGARSNLIFASAGTWIAAGVPWTPAPELVRHLVGQPTAGTLLDAITAPAEALLDAVQEQAVARIRAVLGNRDPLLLHVDGPELTGRRTAVALASSRPVLALDLAQLAPTAARLAEALVALRREAALRGAVPVIAGLDELVSVEGGRDARMRVLAQHLDAADGPVVLVSSWRGIDVGSKLPALRVEWTIPDVATRGKLWRALTGGDAEDAGFDQLAQQFPLGAGAIRRAVTSARMFTDGGAAAGLTPAALQAGVRQNIAERMGGLAERVVVKQTWDDLVLGDDVMAQIRALVGRVEHAHLVFEQWGYRSKLARGVGVAALFSGPPGTGKTMVAGIIAGELGLELYQVDLSKVVSKWVGETEKQLAKVFDAAEAGHVLLLFDEADALFGQRSTEMRGASDRYANLEVNFLLQRIESFNGIVILTTNLDSSIDTALRRRLAAHVVFQHPDDDERARLWERMTFASGAPLDRNIDPGNLALVFPKMTGANIRNAALAAAFLAAAEGRQRIDHATVMQAGRSEYLSMGHVLAATAGL